MKPEYAQNIVVGTIRQSKFEWYVTNKEIWFLDYQAWGESFGLIENEEAKERFGIVVVDQNHEKQFFENLIPYKASCNMLRENLKKCISEEEKMDFVASLLIDFDRHHFISFFPEPDPIERYVPKLWTSEYKNFENDIPPSMKYWIDENGDNLFKENES